METLIYELNNNFIFYNKEQQILKLTINSDKYIKEDVLLFIDYILNFLIYINNNDIKIKYIMLILLPIIYIIYSC